jgi:uncharacterized protein YkwD
MNNQHNRRLCLAFALLIASLGAPSAAVPGHESAEVPGRGPDPGLQITGIPSTEEMERDLLAAINKERGASNLPILRQSRPLTDLARNHSAEMARRNILSHESAAGKSFTDRLTDAGVPFAANGENVARSGTFVADLIHQSFMESPGHRENVLSRDFDEAGIGIVRGPGNTYFVTEDFIRGLVQKPLAEVRALVLGALNEMRAQKNLAPVVMIDVVNRIAEAFVKARAAGRELPSVPSFFGKTAVRLAIGPELAQVMGVIKENDLAGRGRAGIGVWFSRSPEYPGGAYVVCVLLVEDSGPAEPDELGRLLRVLKAANDLRARNRLEPLALDTELSRRADDVVSMRRRAAGWTPPALAQAETFFFMFQKLGQFDDKLRKRIADPAFRRIGISTLPIRLEDGGQLQYAVAVILGR